jgi:hypothetical protein
MNHLLPFCIKQTLLKFRSPLAIDLIEIGYLSRIVHLQNFHFKVGAGLRPALNL